MVFTATLCQRRPGKSGLQHTAKDQCASKVDAMIVMDFNVNARELFF